MMEIAVLCVAVFTAYFVKGVVGFANSIVASSIMGFTNSNVDISPLDLILTIPANVM